ncbi:uncharacterized protein LOC132548809 [Ylistrum balloti]|uniref:uncharacterized protein LOC132548809 n=1 Tax=Ylistrum balloti TaxID=509963 RepID=UPI002905D534|nr:uncharacterized protein LOC132548809 [Ylistrum balloti]
MKHRFYQETFLVFKHIGIQQCARECLLQRKCKAVAYKRENLYCYLGDNDTYLTTSTNKNEIASSRTMIVQLEKQLLKSCAGHSCDESSVCVELSSGISECVNWSEFGRVLKFPNCIKGERPYFTKTVNRNGPHVQLDGQWSTMSMTCFICNAKYFVFDQNLNFCYRIENSQQNTYENTGLHCNTMRGISAEIDKNDKKCNFLSLNGTRIRRRY